MNKSQKEIGLRRRIGTDNLIGSYAIDSDGNAFFTDIRGEEGDRVSLPSIDELIIPYEKEFLEEGEFYSFSWYLDGDDFIIDGVPKKVENVLFLQKLYDARLKLSGNNLETFNNFQRTIFDEVTGAQHTYIYELLQNANDYPYNGQKVKVNFILTDKYLFFTHTGAPFNLRNVVGITSINQGEKKKNTETIGYKGIGFKTVFVNNEYVYLKSADWSFRFDKDYSEKQFAGECPWALMPIPTPEETLDKEVLETLRALSEEMRVQFALKHKSDARKNIPQLEKVFSDNQILLFIPNVDSVDVIIDDKIRYSVHKNSEKWVVTDYAYPVSNELRNWVSENINNGNKVPEKFKDISNVRISFAVGRDGNLLIPIEGARVYNYLPTELRLGFKFLINADFIPNGSRSGLHDVEWNNHVMQQAGEKFAEWWTSFMEKEGEYDLNSIFNLLPDFNNNQHYAGLFLRGFFKKIRQIPCIPILRYGEYRVCRIREILHDRIGFFQRINPIMSDEDFYVIYKTNLCLVHPELRDNPNCDRLLRYFDKELGNDNKFNGLTLEKLVNCNSFTPWLLIPQNNIRFNGFLIDSEFIDNLKGRALFLKSDGRLGMASKIHANLDKFIEDLDFMEDLLPRLNTEVRKGLEKYQRWDTFLHEFLPFDANKFAASVLNSFGLYSEWFEEMDNSVKFVHFLATNFYQGPLPDKYPLYNEEGYIVANRQELFVRNDIGESFKKRQWIKDEWIQFISPLYYSKDEQRVIKFLENCKISGLTADQCYNKFIDNIQKIPDIAASIKDTEASVDFYRYLWKTSAPFFSQEMRSKYTVLATDGNNEDWITLNTTIFKQDEEWYNLSRMDWMPVQCCWAITDVYYDGLNNEETEDFQSFLAQHQVIQNCSVRGLFNYMSNARRFDEVFAKIQTFNESKCFLHFLWDYKKDTYKLFEKGDFAGLPVLVMGHKELEPLKCLSGRIYIPTQELLDLYNQKWFDATSVCIIHSHYQDVFDNGDKRAFFEKLGFKKFDLLSYVRKEILPNLSNLVSFVQDKDSNLAFHHFFASIHSELSEKESEPLKEMPIFISSPIDENGMLVSTSTNHYLPSPFLNEVIEQDIVPIEIINSVHSSYIVSALDERYLENTLKNVPLSLMGFIEYIQQKIETVKPYLEDQDRNIRFWNWISSNISEKSALAKLTDFPLLCQDGTLKSPTNIYISNIYSEPGTEEFIRRFVPGASIVADAYHDANPDFDWKFLFGSVGLNVSTKEILFKDVVPNLQHYKDSVIVLELAKNLQSIRARLENKDGKLKDCLSRLQLLCVDNIHRTPAQSIISGQYFDIEKETYPDIRINNIVSAKYIEECGENHNLRRQVIELMKLLGDTYNCACENSTQLRRKKLEYFNKHQDYFLQIDAHFRIISELAADYNADSVGVGELIDRFKRVTLMCSDGITRNADLTYLGSIYGPHCNFQKYGIGQLPYVSDSYMGYGSHFSGLFRKLGVKDVFTESNLPILSNEDFAVYFWTEYAERYRSDVASFIDYEHLRNIKCIPSVEGVKRPNELYHRNNPRLNKIIEQLPNADAKQPCIKLPDWANVGLRGHLYIEDCLDYLKIETPEYRQDVYLWIANTPNDTLTTYSESIRQFREVATWYTGKKDWRPLKDLVALEWADGRSPLKDSFGGNGFVCHPSYMPETKQVYDRICEIFGIKVLSDKDFKKKKGGNCYLDTAARSEIDKRLLYIAYQIDKKKWKEIYNNFHRQLFDTDLYRCERILYFYNENISSNEVYSYIDDPKKLWYVGVWDGRRFAKVLEWMLNSFQLKRHGFTSTSLENMFEMSINQYLQKNEGGAMPPEFLSMLDDADKAGLVIDKNAHLEDGIGEEIVDDEISEETIRKANEARASRRQTNSGQEESERNFGSSKETSSLDDAKEKSEKATSEVRPQNSENKGGIKERDHSRSNSSISRKDEPKSQISMDSKSNESLEEKMERKWAQQKQKGNKHPKGAGFRPRGEETLDLDLKGKISNTSENPSFFSGRDWTPNHSSANPTSDKVKSREDIQRKKTEAQNVADNAEQQLSLYEIWQSSNPYSFKWFKYLMELQFEDKDKKLPAPIQIDFTDWSVADNEQKILRMISPSRPIPKWLEDGQDVKVTLLGKSSWRLECAIISVDGDGIELLIKPEDLTLINDSDKIRVNAQNHTNFIDSLQTSFLELDYAPEYQLDDNLPDDIKFIYGPPGTGKTTRLVSILSDLIRDAGHNELKVLVLTPTNKAADVIAEKLFEDDHCHDALVRFGYTDCARLISGDSDCFKNRDTMHLEDRDQNILVTTMARFAYDTIQPDGLPISDIEWDYIIVDEASMIDIVPITYVLHKARNSKFIIAGDPKQITPIQQHQMPAYNIYNMVGLDSFKDAMNGKCRFEVETLTVQHRAIPVIGNLVSDFCYDGLVKNDPKRTTPKPLQLDGMKIRPINFLGFKVQDMDMLYELSSINESAFQLYSAIFAYNMTEYIVGQIGKRYEEQYSIGIVCPYKAQADAIQQLLENKPLSNGQCEIISGTVHKFQGDECDIMLLVLNPPPKTYAMSHINNTNIINVAMSRARDYIFFLMPEKEEDGYQIKDQLGKIIDVKDRSVHFCGDVERIIYGDSDYIYNNASIQCHQSVNVFYDNRAKYEIRLSDSALDIQIND